MDQKRRYGVLDKVAVVVPQLAIAKNFLSVPSKKDSPNATANEASCEKKIEEWNSEALLMDYPASEMSVGDVEESAPPEIGQAHAELLCKSNYLFDNTSELCINPCIDNLGDIHYLLVHDTSATIEAHTREHSQSFMQHKKLRNLILNRMKKRKRSMRQVFRHFNRSGRKRFTIADFNAALKDLR